MMKDTHSPHFSAVSDVVSARRRSWTVGRVLREAHPALRLRERVRDHPLFERVTLSTLIDDPLSLDGFLTECRLLPQCGEAQVARLRKVLGEEIRAAMAAPAASKPRHVGAGPDAKTPDAHASTALKLEGEFFPDYVTALETVYRRMWRLAQFASFLYLPTSVPEFVKIPAVLAAENGPDRDVAAYSGKLAAFRNALPVLSRGDGAILLDAQRLGALFARQGRYAVLSDEDVARQLEVLRKMLAALPAGIDCRVTDFEHAQLSALSIVGEYLVFYAMGGYGILRSPPMLAQMRSRCRAAQTGGIMLSEFLDGLVEGRE